MIWSRRKLLFRSLSVIGTRLHRDWVVDHVLQIAWTAFMSHMASSTSEESEEVEKARAAAGTGKQLQQQSSR